MTSKTRSPLILLLILLILVGCSVPDDWFAPSATPPAPANPTDTITALPDLAIRSVELEIESGEQCASLTARLGVRIDVANQGGARAGPFVVEVNGAWQEVPDGLGAGEALSLWFTGYTPDTTVWVDATSAVLESDESNNQVAHNLPEPEIPFECLATPTPAVTREGPLFTLEGHTGKVWTVAFSPDGKLLASGSVDNTMRLWRVQEGSLLRTMQGHPFPVLTLDFAPNGSILATGSSDGIIRLFRVSNGFHLHSLSGHAGWVNSLTYSPNGLLLASGSSDFTVRIWHSATGSLADTIDEGMSEILSLAYSPDGNLLAWAEKNGVVRLRDLSSRTWRHIWSVGLEIPANDAEPAELPPVRRPDPAESLAFTPDGSQVAAGFADGSVRLWEVESGALVQTLVYHTGSVSSLAFSPDGRWLVSGSHDGTLRLWQLAPGANLMVPTRIFIGHEDAVNSVAFSPQGDRVASASDDGTVRIWEVPR